MAGKYTKVFSFFAGVVVLGLLLSSVVFAQTKNKTTQKTKQTTQKTNKMMPKPVSQSSVKILYISEKTFNDNYIHPKEYILFLMDANGTILEKLDKLDDFDIDTTPSLSNDKNKIVYRCSGTYLSGGSKPAEIHIYDIKNGTNSVLLRVSEGIYDPRFLPDGSKILFSSLVGVAMVNINGTNARGLGFDGESPSYSPDGLKIVYSKRINDGIKHISTSNSDGTNEKIMKQEGTEPCWSPDGKKIVFRVGDNVSIMDSEGGNIKLITKGYNLSWSSDSKKIVFSKDKDNKPCIYIYDIATRQEKMLKESAYLAFCK
jgi:Tol biopolymer transport system component